MIADARIAVDRYVVSCLDWTHPEWAVYSVYVVYRRNLPGWVVTDGASILDVHGVPVLDPKSLTRSVYATPVAALAVADRIAESRTVAGRSVQDVIRENAGGQP